MGKVKLQTKDGEREIDVSADYEALVLAIQELTGVINSLRFNKR